MGMIKARGLYKSFGDHVVVDGIDLDVGEGMTFALLCPNGAGKTTTVQILSTLIRPDAGKFEMAARTMGEMVSDDNANLANVTVI